MFPNLHVNKNIVIRKKHLGKTSGTQALFRTIFNQLNSIQRFKSALLTFGFILCDRTTGTTSWVMTVSNASACDHHPREKSILSVYDKIKYFQIMLRSMAIVFLSWVVYSVT